MGFYAIQDVEDALDATRALLLPLDREKWLRLAVIAFFVGGIGGTGFNTGGSGGGGGGGGGVPPGTGGEVPPDIVGPILLAAIVLVVLAVLLAIAFALIGSIMEFVLIDSLRTETVRIRPYVRERFGKGLRLFGFRIGIGLLTLGVAGVLLAIIALPLFLGVGGGFAVVIAFVVALPLLILLAFLAAVVSGATTVIVVPVMVAEDLGVIAGWRRFWPVFRREWKQYVVFALVYVVISAVIGFAVGIVVILGGVVVLIPTALVGAIAFGLYSLVPVLGFVAGALAVLVFIAGMAVVVAFVKVPVVTFLRYYALFVLGDTDDDLDVIPDRRAAVRTDGGDGDDSEDGDGVEGSDSDDGDGPR